jgi:hypothetical protein
VFIQPNDIGAMKLYIKISIPEKMKARTIMGKKENLAI